MNHKIITQIPANIKIVAVSKGRTPDEIASITVNDFGENRIEEIESKWGANHKLQELLDKGVKLHFIGKVSGKKIKRIVKFCDYVHSLESIRHAEIFDKYAKKYEKVMQCFVQVNVAQEPQKSGIAVEEVGSFLEECHRFENIDIIGLMTMAPKGVDPSLYFASLQSIARKYNIENLSMGMSDDYHIAIRYGANFIRIGRKLFEAI